MEILRAPGTSMALALRSPASFSSAKPQLAWPEQERLALRPAAPERPVRPHPLLGPPEPDPLLLETVLRPAGAERRRGLAMWAAATFVAQPALELALAGFGQWIRKRLGRRARGHPAAGLAPGRHPPVATRGPPVAQPLVGRTPARKSTATQWLPPEPRRGP
jgi:hypothetical protein